jgi:hypothetical protein
MMSERQNVERRPAAGGLAAADDLERDKVVRWRLEQLAAAGYDSRSALILAMDSSVDLHQAVALLRSGCPLDTALRILF